MMKLPKTSHHIALYVPSLRGGGAERVMVMLANGFAALGHRVDLVITKAEGPYLSEVAPEVRVIDFNRGRVLSSFLPLVRYLRSERPDAMLSALSHANIIAILARMAARVPVRLAVSEHSAPSHSLSGGGMAAVLRTLIRPLYPRADAIICVSNGARQEFCEMFSPPPHKVHCIYNPLDVDRIDALKNQTVVHEALSENGIPVILAVGRLTAAKDYPNLLNAFAILRMKRQARLIILGQGEAERPLKTLAHKLTISDDVAFAGFQHNPFAWMKTCNLYVMSSQWEGLPGTLLEALACGARVVSTDCRTGPAEILQNGKWGRLVPTGDSNALACAMEEALDDINPPDGTARARDFNIQRAVDLYAQVILKS